MLTQNSNFTGQHTFYLAILPQMPSKGQVPVWPPASPWPTSLSAVGSSSQPTPAKRVGPARPLALGQAVITCLRVVGNWKAENGSSAIPRCGVKLNSCPYPQAERVSKRWMRSSWVVSSGGQKAGRSSEKTSSSEGLSDIIAIPSDSFRDVHAPSRRTHLGWGDKGGLWQQSELLPGWFVHLSVSRLPSLESECCKRIE